MREIFVGAVGLVGPGLAGWAAARAALAGIVPYCAAPVVLPALTLLPPAERRRVPALAKLALTAAVEALAQSGTDVAELATVFTSASGDGDTLHEIMLALTTPAREVSPTRFHNSVHNAASGYWALATRARAPSSSLGAFDDSFAAGLLEAACQVVVDGRAVMLIAYDSPFPEPLHASRPIGSQFGMALLLTPEPADGSLAGLRLDVRQDGQVATAMPDPALDRLRLGNPAARSLPLLAALAGNVAQTVRLDINRDAGMDIQVVPR